MQRKLQAGSVRQASVARRAHDCAAVGALHDEREHAVGEIRLDRVHRLVEKPVALVGREPHVQRAALVALDDFAVQPVCGESIPGERRFA
jgi:hypothetical protein